MSFRAADRFVDFLANRHRLLLVLAAALTVLSIGPSRQLSFDQSIESLYSDRDPHLKDYVESKRLFGGDEIVFVCFTDPELFTDAGQGRVSELSNRLMDVPGVDVPDAIAPLLDRYQKTVCVRKCSIASADGLSPHLSWWS